MSYSHVLLIPLISGFFIFAERKKLFQNIQYDFTAGTAIIAAGVIIYLFGRIFTNALTQNDFLSIIVCSFVLLLIGGLVLFYGAQCIKGAPFPFLFLIFMIPIPTFILNTLIFFLVRGTAEITHILFKLTGTTFLRDRFLFHLPQLSVEVADECSGIRSSIALFITSVMAGHLFLKNSLQKGILYLSVIPITLFKNSLRIVTLTLLGAYINRNILSSSIHRQGGKPFFVLALIMLLIVLWVLKKINKMKKQKV